MEMGEGGFGRKSGGGGDHVAQKRPLEGFTRQRSNEQGKDLRAKEGGAPRGNEEVARDPAKKRACEKDDGERRRWPKMPSEKNGLARLFFTNVEMLLEGCF
jgi:hypothetical protein